MNPAKTGALPTRRQLPINPLATRYVSPGKLPWIPYNGSTLQKLADDFRQSNRCGQIIGPHGSGKSTLLEHLLPQLGRIDYRESAAGDRFSRSGTSGNSATLRSLPSGSDESSIYWFSLRRDHSVVKSLLRFLQARQFCGILVIDGAEQLSWWQRWRVTRWSRRQSVDRQEPHRQCAQGQGAGLLWTAHADLGLPTLWHTDISPSLARQIVAQAYRNALGHTSLPAAIAEAQWPELLRKHNGNLRECLMELFDLIEITHREASEIGC